MRDIEHRFADLNTSKGVRHIKRARSQWKARSFGEGFGPITTQGRPNAGIKVRREHP